jgi:2-polyprenyl-6-methoxyphenol hydroxylase-like FAD-dependent oxidoreductase
MKDAMELSEAIIKTLDHEWNADSLDSAVRRYEEAMFARIHVVQKMTEDMMKLMLFTDGSPRTTIDKWIVRSMSDDLHPLLTFIVQMIVSFYYFFFKMIY